MEVTQITFNIKDVITIIIGISSFTGLYYALKRSVEKVSLDLNVLEVKQKQDTEAIMTTLQDQKKNIRSTEERIDSQIDKIREEQKTANDKLESKMDTMANHLSTMSTSLAELTGYIKAKKP